MSNGTLIGVVLIARHGDRQGYFQDPHSYTASDTTITPLGSVQTYNSGIGLRNRYFVAGAERRLDGVSWPKVDLGQVDFKADASEGQVIVDSTYSLAQGLYPADAAGQTIVLANGTNVTSPLGGYVYVPIETVEADEDISLEGWTSCAAFTKWTSQVYASQEFKAVASANADYLTSIKPFLGDRNVTLANMYNVFDYMNVNYIHNKDFRANVTEQQMEQARALADYHEQAVFSSPTKDGIGNIAGQTILPVILEALERFTDSSDPLIVQYIGVAYKPLVSLMNMTEVGIPGFVNYAAVTALELRNSSGTLTISFNFRNTSEAAADGSDYVAYPMFGTSSPELSYATFSDKLRPYSLASLGEWCNKCGTTDVRGCDVIDSLNDTMNDFASATSTRGRHHVSPVVAGLIGAVVGIIAALVFLFVGGTLFKKSGRRFGAGKESQVQRGRSEEADSAYEMDQNDLKSKQHAEI